MVTCMTCRHEIDDGGHLRNCPILNQELKAIRVKAMIHTMKKVQ